MKVGLVRLFREFFVLGATGFGTSMLPYYEKRMVQELRWIEPDEFVPLLQIAQTLPGLNATNLSVMLGDRLAGPLGAVVATVGLLLPGVLALCLLGGLYLQHRHDPRVDLALDGVAAAAAGLLVATAWRLSQKSPGFALFVLATVVAVVWGKLSLPLVLVLLAPVSIYARRPR